MLYAMYKDPQGPVRLVIAVAAALVAIVVGVVLLIVLPFVVALVLGACGAAVATYWVFTLFD